MQITIASDHAGFKLKNKIIQHLKSLKYKVSDLGCDDEQPVDYPDYTKLVVEHMLEGLSEIGILICGTGIGMSIAANRNSEIRAALCINEFMAERSRSHNDANILVLGSKLQSDAIALKMIDKFLNTKFEGGRHQRRLSKI